MIKSVEIINSYGEKIKMVLDDPELNGYAITNISGIEPVQVDIKQTQLVSGLKYKYNFGFYKSREITFSIVYLEWLRDQDEQYVIHRKIEEARDNLYKYFKTNDKIQMIFERGRRDGNPGTQLFHIEGYVNKHQPTFFSQSCGATISVTCPDPWFKECWWTGDPSDPVLNFTTVVESTGSNLTIDYPGDIFTGFKFTSEQILNNYAGKSLKINSIHNSKNRFFAINVPTKYNSYGLLTADLSSDIISVYTSNEITGMSTDYYVAMVNSKDLEERNMVKVNVLNPGDRVLFEGYSPSGATARRIGLEVDDGDEYIINEATLDGIIRIEKRNLFKVYYIITGDDYVDPNMTVEIMTDSGDNFCPDHSQNERVKLGAFEDNYCSLVEENLDKTFIYYGNENNLTTNDKDVGFIFAKKALGHDDENKNRNGWIDATSISNRQEIPALYPGENLIKFRINNYSSYMDKFKIEYNTLYRGL